MAQEQQDDSSANAYDEADDMERRSFQSSQISGRILADEEVKQSSHGSSQPMLQSQSLQINSLSLNPSPGQTFGTIGSD